MPERIRREESSAERVRRFTKSIVALTGPPLVGKTTLGRALEKLSNFVYLDIDEARWEIFPRTRRLPQDQERAAMRASYKYNHERAKAQLEKGKPVIVGATYSWEGYHQMLKNLAESALVPLRVFLLEVPDNEIKRRVEARRPEGNDSTTITAEVAIDLKKRFRPIEGVYLVKIDSALPVEENVERVFQSLSDLEIREWPFD